MLTAVSLNDKYTRESGRIFVTGIQALVRLPLLQAAQDRVAGLNTAGYITGYRGSPLGGYDLQLWQAQELLEKENIVFQPGINEDLAATAIWGTQQAEIGGRGKFDGVFCIWYGKGPGVDRSGDAMRHANLAGTSRFGGVLAALGDDHACESSTTAHQSEYALVNTMIPVLNPSGVQDILDFGLAGWALSRYSGCWIGLKCVHDTVEATATIDIDLTRSKTVMPENFQIPAGGLNIRWPDTPLEQEARLHEYKLPAVHAFWAANSFDRIIYDSSDAVMGIVTTGKSYSDVRRALKELDIDEQQARKFGIRLYKVAMSWPLEPEGLHRFASGLKKIIVVEEKRGLMEEQIKALLYGQSDAPVVIGKRDETGAVLLPAQARLNAMQIASVLGQQLGLFVDSESLRSRVDSVRQRLQQEIEPPHMQRIPYFCAGCPHNTSTKVPEGSIALAGIGCHYMAQWMDRSTERFTQMGGEGAGWIGESHFSTTNHVFQNIGDGTYLHSGLLAVRAAVAANANMTFKLLYNDAVAMTGGQPFDGPLSSTQMARQLLAEGVRQVYLVTDEPEKYSNQRSDLIDVQLAHRSELEAIQKALRKHPGVTAIVYEQTCAAEKRRRRKRGEYPDPPKRVFINTAVCEGCGDCGIQSNCIAVVPEETEFGRKRRIDQSACNKDYSCVDGFCPSFVTVHGGDVRKPHRIGPENHFDLDSIPEPDILTLDNEYAIVVSGVGGTGVITTGAILGMAAHIAGLGCSILDMTGLAQKGGAVITHLILAAKPDNITSMHVATGGANLAIGYDLVTAASKGVLETMKQNSTHAVVNEYEMMPGEFSRNRDLLFPADKLKRAIRNSIGDKHVDFLNANEYMEQLFGDTMAVNMFMVGVAYQKGHIPIHREAIEQSIELNGRSVQLNLQAFQRGRQYVAAKTEFEAVARPEKSSTFVPFKLPQTLDELIAHREMLLVQYQNKTYAKKYRQLVDVARQAEAQHSKGMSGFAESVARYYYKLLAYKDEYEVARLFSSAEFAAELENQFEGDYTLRFYLAPPILTRRNKLTGIPIKKHYGPWMMTALKLLARMKFLRGTALDPFAYSKDRKLERQLIEEYQTVIEETIQQLNPDNYRIAVEVAAYPETIRGYGHVKQKSAQETRERVAKLQEALRDEPSRQHAA